MRKVFFSFDWGNDAWRSNQVRNSWVTKGRYEFSGFLDAADREKVKRNDSEEIKKWINEQLHGTSVTCVLIGHKTHRRKWVNYEIEQSIKKGNGLFGVYIHNLKNSKGKTDRRGENPLPHRDIGEKAGDALLVGGAAYGMTRIMFPQVAIPATILAATWKALSPGKDYRVYDWIEDSGYENIDNWIEYAAKQVGR